MWQNGFNNGLGNIMMLSDAKSRSITAENVYGEKGGGAKAEWKDEAPPGVLEIGQSWDGKTGQANCSRELGQGWKVRPCITLVPGKETTLMDVDGPGVIQHIWMTIDEKNFRNLILRFYWDDETTPSVEVPLGDFFCCGWKSWAKINSIPVNVNPSKSLHCFWPMPFRKHARVTIENRHTDLVWLFFYQIDYSLTEVPAEAAYFHAQFRRSNPLKQLEVHTILDGVKGRGHYAGTFMCWQNNSAGWWGEGEVKFYMDGDGEFPTICGTGTEDYFGGAWGFAENFSAPFMGKPFGPSDDKPGGRHTMYRWHIMDPVRFEKDLRVTIQALGWRDGGRYLSLQDDICSTAFWYQTLPSAPFPKLGSKDELEII